MKGHGPADWQHAPRVAGVTTFLRLPHVTDLDGVDVAFVGLPFDCGLAVRAGARFGPRAVREGSARSGALYNPAQRVDLFERLSVVDAGDSAVVHGFTDRSLQRMHDTLAPIAAAGVVPIGIGGDHTVLLAELRAAAERHGPLALVQFGAHTDAEDVHDGKRYVHATVVRRALEEGLIDAGRSTLLGMRGGLERAGQLDEVRELGFTVLPWDELAQLGTGAAAAAVDRARGKAFLTVDVDVVDPAFAPGVGTPEVGGPTSMQALALIRACRGLDIAGADVVEVIPELDASRLTGLFAAAVAYEILTLIAAERKE